MSFFINFFKKATVEQRLISSQIAQEYKSDEADNAKEIMRQQVEAVDRMVPATVIFNLINIGILSLLLKGAVPDLQLFGWASLTTIISVSAALVWWHNNFSDIENLDQIEAARSKLIAAAAARALIWGVAFIMFLPQVGPVHQIVIGLTAGGMLCAGAFGMSPMPRAAITYLGIMATSMIVALVLTGIWEMYVVAVMMVIFFLYLVSMVRNQNLLLTDQIKAELHSREQQQTIALLLKDFEQNSSDWLWRTDYKDRFKDVSARFAEVSGRTDAMLLQTSFAELFGPDPEFLNIYACENIRRREALVDVVVSTEVAGARRFWSLTAEPQADRQGNFLGYNGVATDISEKLFSEKRLRTMAHTDQLTGVVNRRRFMEQLEDALSKYAPESVALLSVDLTGFKLINDTMGHPVGDGLLVQIAKRLEAWAAPGVTVARLGGDEFAIMVFDIEDEAQVRQLAEELLDLFERAFEVAPHSLLIDACVGFATGDTSACSAIALMTRADLALYAAKADGRGTSRAFEAAMSDDLLRRQQVERALHGAIERGEFSLRYQPIIDVKTGRVQAYEALLRWNSAELGPVSPSEFVPIAEDCGLIVPIGDWVLRAAVVEAAEWPRDIHVCVNVSPAQLRNSRLLGVVVQALDRSGLLPNRLTVEITEGVFLESSEHISRTLHDLLNLGIEVALDDFGTGYSSLSYLRSFPLSKLKIDKSFVADMDSNPANVKIIRAIIEMAGALGFKVIAEGVETEAQLKVLTELECDYLQGFLFAAPQMPAELIVLDDHRRNIVAEVG